MKKLFKMKYKTFEKIVTTVTSLIVILITLLSYMVAKIGNLNLIQYEYILGCFGVINFIIILIAIQNDFYKFRLCDLFIILLIIFAIISTIFSFSPKTSLIGVEGRNEGLLIILTYYSLFLTNSLIKEDKYKEIIILVFLISSLFHLQDKMFSTFITGLAGHYNFFGTMCLLVYSLSLGLFIFKKEKNKKYLYLIISSLYFPYLLGCVTSSVTLALVFVYIAIIAYILIILFMKKFKKIKKNQLDSISNVIIKLTSLVAILVLCFFISGRDTNDIKKEVISVKNDIQNLLHGTITNDWGSQRGFIWKETLKIVPKHLWHGVGIDCLVYAWDGSFLITPGTNRIVDKTHNEYLQILITEGIFSCITYIVFVFYIFFSSIKNILKHEQLNNTIYVGLFLAFMGYIIQAFANIRVTRVAPYFFILTGLLYQRYRVKDEK